MFGKLVKYELKSISRWHLALLFITILIALVTKNFLYSTSSFYYAFGDPLSIYVLMSLIVLGGLTLSITIASYVIIVRRFYSSIFGRQGYLTMTLPVSIHSLILSKLLVAVFLIVMFYLIFASIFAIFIIPSNGLAVFISLIQNIASDIVQSSSPLWIALEIVTYLLSVVQSILLIYLAIATGQLFNSHRILMGFVSYGIICVILILISLLLTITFTDTSLILANFIVAISLLLLAYLSTHTIIKYKLNLE